MNKLSNILFAFLLVLYPCSLRAESYGSDVKLPDDYQNLPKEKKWRAKPIASYPTGEKGRAIAFLLDKDNELRLDFISYMRSDAAGKWNGCFPFIINVMSKGNSIFLDNEAVLNLMTSVQNYADALCPTANKILFFASPKPFGMAGVDLPVTEKTDDNITFAAKIEKNEDGRWSFSPDNVINRVQRNQEDQENSQETLTAIYQTLQTYPPSRKAAFLFDAEDLDNPFLMMKAAKIANNPVPAVFIFHIKQMENSKGWIDEPFPMMLNDIYGNITQNGWYIGSGLIKPLSPKEKMKAGIKKKSPAAFFELEDAFKCEDKSCKETDDIISLIQRKYKIHDWKPYK
ncbi:MAG: hypothetical protein IKD08_06220 [Alphaproteobacteria bacterium]|nr:hypothetical protein [Alphaproteobacteria bacterium]